MNRLYTESKYKNSRYKDPLSLKCFYCHKAFSTSKKSIADSLRKVGKPPKFCSRNCVSLSERKREIVSCKECNRLFEKTPFEIKKSSNHFCGHSCHCTYLNRHKKFGIRRSKLEHFIENQINKDFPNLCILYNDRTTLGLELDVYVPSLALAIEFNGVFHYQPIFGVEKLNKIRNNDFKRKVLCKNLDITLHSIDISSIKHFNNSLGFEIYEIVRNIIDSLNKAIGKGIEPSTP